ncbi:vWA domain-containing protein [Micromonospora sp. DT81.3]|uniref:vWA domain-containing protein n=1 Tax=Micromonospora sp. DT81.3 TaxID=3416523 RepID=UPI003CE6AB5F
MYIDEAEYDSNDPRCPLVLILDTSTSMGRPRVGPGGEPLERAMEQLNRGLRALASELRNDAVAERRVEIRVVTFGGQVRVQGDWQLAADWRPPTLTASGRTPMGEAIRTSLKIAQARREELAEKGIASYRPWLFLLTDGEPTDDITVGADAITAANRSHDSRQHVLFWPVAAQGANPDVLRTVDPSQPVLALDETDWSSLFQWVSHALAGVSRSRPGEQLKIQPWTITL